MIENSKKERIAHEVIKTLYSRFMSFPEDASNNRNAPFHEAFLNAFSDKLDNKVSDISFFISLSSWLHGLNTTLGQSFFENIAHILSDGYKKEFTSKRKNLLKISKLQKNSIADIITDLKNGNCDPDKKTENSKIYTFNDDPNLDANGFTADVFFENDRDVFAIELKTVRPNAGEMRGEKQKILEAKAALYNHYKNKNINFFIGFPFDPTSEVDVEHDKNRFLGSIIDGKKYFADDEVLLADDLWNFLSEDDNTMRQILDIINSIATTKFMDNFTFLSDKSNHLDNTEDYKDILERWFLYGELKLIKNMKIILKKIEENSRLTRIYNQPIFKEGKYNLNRFDSLANPIK